MIRIYISIVCISIQHKYYVTFLHHILVGYSNLSVITTDVFNVRIMMNGVSIILIRY